MSKIFKYSFRIFILQNKLIMFFLKKKKGEKRYRKEEKNISDKGFKINKNENEVTLRR